LFSINTQIFPYSKKIESGMNHCLLKIAVEK